MLANPCIGAPRHRLLTGHPSQHSSGTRVPPRCSKRHRGQWVVSGELTRFSQAPQYRPASPTDRLPKRMETGRGGCCNPSPASVSDQVHQTSYPYEEAFKQDTGGAPVHVGWPWIDTERPLTSLKNPLGNRVERQTAKSSMIDHAGAKTSAIRVPVIVSHPSSMRLGRISPTIEAMRWGTACRPPYLSKAWMCPRSELAGFIPAFAWPNT